MDRFHHSHRENLSPSRLRIRYPFDELAAAPHKKRAPKSLAPHRAVLAQRPHHAPALEADPRRVCGAHLARRGRRGRHHRARGPRRPARSPRGGRSPRAQDSPRRRERSRRARAPQQARALREDGGLDRRTSDLVRRSRWPRARRHVHLHRQLRLRHQLGACEPNPIFLEGEATPDPVR